MDCIYVLRLHRVVVAFQELKKLKHAISIVESDKSKLLESLEDYERYRQVHGRLRARVGYRCNRP